MDILRCCCCLRPVKPVERRLSSQEDVVIVQSQVSTSTSIQSLFWFDDLVTEQQKYFEEMSPHSFPPKRIKSLDSPYETSSTSFDFSRRSSRSYTFTRNHFRNTFYRNLMMRQSFRSGKLESSQFSKLESDILSVMSDDSVFSDSSVGLYEFSLDLHVSQTDARNCVPKYYRITYVSDEDIPLMSTSAFPYFPSYNDSDCDSNDSDNCLGEFSEDDSGFYFDEDE